MEYKKPSIEKLRVIVVGGLTFLGEIANVAGTQKITRSISIPSNGYVSGMEMATWICTDAIGELDSHEIGAAQQLIITELSKAQIIQFNNLLARYELLAINIEAHICNKRFVEANFGPFDAGSSSRPCPPGAMRDSRF
jgi:hypothetical protein